MLFLLFLIMYGFSVGAVMRGVTCKKSVGAYIPVGFELGF